MSNVVRALSVSLILILSSLAGCLTDDETTDASGDDLDELLNYGTVMVSTYHVGELVSAVAGDSVSIEYMSQDNIPVHDYEPSAADLIRLQEADIFFYHGLNLEPWVESTLSSLGEDAPPSYMTHAVPSGASNLAYESMLISDLCELMNDGPFESTTLGMVSDGHDDHDDHDDHGDDDHDDHDDHDAHEHAEADMTFENPVACPADTTIQVFHMEAGEHILEFESEHDEDFNMAVLKMLGGHAHHDHHSDEHGDDHDNHDDEMCHNTETHENYDSTKEECEAAGHMWVGDGDHDDTHGDEMCHDEEAHENYESTEEECEAAGDMWLGHDEHVLPEVHAELVAHTLSFFEAISIEGEWIDEWNSSQVIDSDSWNSNTITHYDNDEMWAVAENGADSWNPGFWSKYDWTWNSEDLYYCQSTFAAVTEADALSANSANATDLDTGCGGFPWSQMDHAHDDQDNHDEMVCYDMNTHTVNMSLTTESDCQAAGLMWTAANSGPGEDDHSDEEEHHAKGAVVIHIEAEGDYGFVLPNDIQMYIVMGDSGHDDHDGHDDHGDDDHDDHGDDDHGDDDHDDHGDDADEIDVGDDEDGFTYDPHSWLSPIAFEAQVNVVLASLSSTFPDGSVSFTENAASYSVQLIDLHERFTAAFGVDGTCDMAGQDKTIVANHNAYSYMSVQYDIDIITLHGLDPEGEPSPADIAEVVESIEEKGITVLFVEEYTDQTAVNSIVEQTGVSLKILYTMEMAPSDSSDNYLSMMNKNLENIISGCGC